MKKLILTFLIITFTFTILPAEEQTPSVQEEPTQEYAEDNFSTENDNQPQEQQPSEIGSAAAHSARMAAKSNWANWAIAGAAVIITGVGLILLSIHDGKSAH